jgi:hypothetical protein
MAATTITATTIINMLSSVMVEIPIGLLIR